MLLAVCAALAIFGIYAGVERIGNSRSMSVQEVGEADCIIVPGAGVLGDKVSAVLARRLDKALSVYNEGKIKKIIVSGDHGSDNYNEVKAMKNYLTERGVPAENIFMDHAGFSTYDTIYRAKEVFKAQKAVVVTQKLQLCRALYIAYALGLDYVGVAADEADSASWAVQQVREIPARVKAFVQCRILHSAPKYLGETIPVTTESGLVTEG